MEELLKEINRLEAAERKKYEKELVEDLDNLIRDFVHQDGRFRYLKRSTIRRILSEVVKGW